MKWLLPSLSWVQVKYRASSVPLEEDVGALPCSPAGQISCPTWSWQWRSGPLWFLGTAAVECGGVYHWENVQSKQREGERYWPNRPKLLAQFDQNDQFQRWDVISIISIISLNPFSIIIINMRDRDFSAKYNRIIA